MKKVLLFILVVLVLAIVVIAMTLGSNNDQVITFNYRISTLLATLFGVGFVLGWIVSGVFFLRVRLSLVRAKRKIKRLESEQTKQESQENRSTAVSTVK